MIKYLDRIEECPDDVNYRIYLLLSNSIDGEAITTVRNIPEGKGVEMYASLEERYKSTRATRKFMLLRQLLQAKCQDPVDVLRFLDEKVSAGAELAQMDIKVDELIVLSILDNLPDEFRGISELAMAQERVSVEMVKRLVTEKYDQFCLREQADRVGAVGLAIEGKRCYQCNALGHLAADCRKKKREQSYNGDARKPEGGRQSKFCSKCKKKNHTASECWSSKRNSTKEKASARIAEALHASV